MRLDRLSLTNFRRFEGFEAQLGPRANSFLGANGKGKTSIIEAAWLLITTGQSFRTHRLSHLIRTGEKSASIHAYFTTHGVQQEMAIHIIGNRRTLSLNRKKLTSPTQALGCLVGVSISPEDLETIRGAPSSRRLLLDLTLSKSNPLYLHHLRRYSRSLQQRNALLKRDDLRTIRPFEEEMAKSALYIREQRDMFIQQLNEQCADLYSAITDKGKLSMSYQREKEELPELFEKMRKREAKVGYSLVGPHRDDLIIKLSAQPIIHFGSEGEKKSALIALKFACWSLLKEQLAEPPILLVDDVEAHLDAKRQGKLFKMIGDFGQVLVTSTDLNRERTGERFLIE